MPQQETANTGHGPRHRAAPVDGGCSTSSSSSRPCPSDAAPEIRHLESRGLLLVLTQDASPNGRYTGFIPSRNGFCHQATPRQPDGKTRQLEFQILVVCNSCCLVLLSLLLDLARKGLLPLGS